VLADDNFATIVNAVETGRNIDDNIRKSVVFLLPTSIAEALMIAMAILLGYQLPITPLQILWVNMITAVTLGLALAFERSEAGVMLRPPRQPGAPMLSAFVIWRCGFVSLLILAGVMLLHGLERTGGASLEYARTTAVSALVWFEAVYLISARRLDASSLNVSGLLGNRGDPSQKIRVRRIHAPCASQMLEGTLEVPPPLRETGKGHVGCGRVGIEMQRLTRSVYSATPVAIQIARDGYDGPGPCSHCAGIRASPGNRQQQFKSLRIVPRLDLPPSDLDLHIGSSPERRQLLVRAIKIAGVSKFTRQRERRFGQPPRVIFRTQAEAIEPHLARVFPGELHLRSAQAGRDGLGCRELRER
jgi:hypothetical protein